VHEIRHAVYAQRHGQVVEVHVAGLGDGLVHVDGAMPPLLPVAVFVLDAWQPVVAGAKRPMAEIGHAVFQARQPIKRLDGGTGRVQATQGTVVQGLAFRILQGFVILGGNTGDEGVGVVTGLADEHQYAAGFDVDGNGGTIVFSQGLVRDFLQLDVQRQVNVGTGDGLDRGNGVDRTRLGVGFDFLVTGGAEQL